MGRALANEFAKMRRLRILPVAVVLVIGVLALTCIELTNPGFMDSVGEPAGQPWKRLLVGLTFGVPMVSPILLAVLASRPVDIEHQGNGWLFSQTSGMTPGYLCRVKFVATGAVVVAATLAPTGLVYLLGKLIGITVAFPTGQWLGYSASIVVVNLALFALHLLLSALMDNQLPALGIGVLGVFFAISSTTMPGWLAHLLPWGYYALALPVDYRDGVLVSLTPSYWSVAGLAVVGGVLFLLITRRFDRQEG